MTQDSLVKIQQAMAKAIISGAPMPGGLLVPESHLMIYRQTMFDHYHRALKKSFGLIYQLIGAKNFAKLTYLYSMQYQFDDSHLGYFGNTLSVWLKDHNEWQDFPYLSDLAQFEWACLSALANGYQALAFSFDKLSAIATKDYLSLHFTLHPSCQLISLHYPISKLYNSLQTQSLVNIYLQDETLLLHNKHHKLNIISLTKEEIQFLQILSLGQSLAQINDNKVLRHLPTLLIKWINHGVIIDCYSK
jgi:hypothetical protein